jgi:hypothetical protein
LFLRGPPRISGSANTMQLAGQLRHRAGGGFHAQNSLARSLSRGNMASFL